MKKNNNLKYINKVEKEFSLSASGMRRMVRDFHSEMKKGLRGAPGSLKMIPTYVDIPTGKEKGLFLALDLGGTNFRVLELELYGGGKTGDPVVRKYVLDKKSIAGPGSELFDFFARCIESFMKDANLSRSGEIKLGFTFSFPIKQTSVASGSLVLWTKGFKATGVVGRDVVGLLNDALRRKGLNNIRVTALANDTVGTLIAKSYSDKNCDVGVIIGTGTNACYREKVSNIKKWRGARVPSGRMIINIEWGNFNKLTRTKYDTALDRNSANPGDQRLEKMVSGMYMGEVVRLVLLDMIKRGILFGGREKGCIDDPGRFKTEYVSVIELDASSGLKKTDAVLKDIGIKYAVLYDRLLVRNICDIVSRRGARICASALAAVVTKMDAHLSRKHTIAIDGSVYEKHPAFAKKMGEGLKDIFGKKASRIRIELSKDGSGKGAAIIAAVA
jgi:hexokinase